VSPDLHAGFLRDLLDHTLVRHVLDEHGFDCFGLDLLDSCAIPLLLGAASVLIPFGEPLTW
jgi:hypothetical protein